MWLLYVGLNGSVDVACRFSLMRGIIVFELAMFWEVKEGGKGNSYTHSTKSAY